MENIITSTKNDLVLSTLKIKNNPEDKLFLEGIKLLEEAVKTNHIVDYLLVEKSYYEALVNNYPWVKNYTIYLVSNNVIEKLCDTKTPQGLVSVINFSTQNKYSGGYFVVLDGLQDPGNLGSIIRSSCGTSFNNIMLIESVNAYSQKVVRSSMGGIFKTNIITFASRENFLDYAKKNNLLFYSATMEGKSVFDFQKPKKDFGIVIGNEGNGVSSLLKSSSVGLLSIPMKNNLESLNAAVSASIMMYVLDNK